MIKIAFYIPLLNIGGAERVVIDILNFLSINNNEFKFFLIVDKVKSAIISQVNPRVETIHLDNKQLFGVVHKAYLIKKILVENNINIIFSHLSHANIHAFLSKRLFNCDLILIFAEHNVLSSYLSSKKSIKHYILRKLSKIAYSRANAIVAVSESVKRDLVLEFGVDKDAIYRIYNPLDAKRISKLSLEEIESEISERCKDKKVFLCIGRLEPQKNHLLLLKSFRQIVQNFDDAILLIIGNGSLYQQLNEYISKHELTDNVFLLGHKVNPYKYFKLADYFILSSVFEGFGIVLVEALFFNKIIISTDIEAAREVLENGKYGVLCGLNENSMINKINDVLRAEYSRVEPCNKLKQYDVECVCDQYLDVIRRLTNERLIQ